MPLVLQLLDIIPLLLPFILFTSCPALTQQAAFIERLAPIILVFVIWFAIRNSIKYHLQLLERKKMKVGQRQTLFNRIWPLLIIGCTVVGALLLMLTFQAVKLRYDQTVFYLTLAYVGADAISESLLVKKRALLSTAPKTLAHAILGYLVFHALSLEWQWQALLFSSAIALQLIALRLSFLMLAIDTGLPVKRKNNGKASSQQQKLFKRVGKLYGVLLFLAPSCIAFLSLTHQIPKHYILIYGLSPFAGQLISSIQKSAHSSQLDSGFLKQNFALCLLTVLVILLISLLLCVNLFNLF